MLNNSVGVLDDLYTRQWSTPFSHAWYRVTFLGHSQDFKCYIHETFRIKVWAIFTSAHKHSLLALAWNTQKIPHCGKSERSKFFHPHFSKLKFFYLLQTLATLHFIYSVLPHPTNTYIYVHTAELFQTLLCSIIVWGC